MKQFLLLFFLFCSLSWSQVGLIRGTGTFSGPGGAVPYTAVISWPSGTVAGDLAIIIVGTATVSSITGPTGWTSLTTFGRNAYGGFSYFKTLNSTDIAVGNTTWSNSVDNGTYGSIITFQGNFTIRGASQSSSGGSPASVTLSGTQVSDLAVFWGNALFSNGDIVFSGSTSVISGGYPTMAAYAVITAGSNGSTATWTWSGSVTNNSGILEVVVENAGGLGAFTANPSVFGIAVQ